MSIIDNIIKGFIIMAIYALLSNFTIKDMKIEALKAHKRGIMSYKVFTESLTGE